MKIRKYPRGFVLFSSSYSEKDFNLPEDYRVKKLNSHWSIGWDTYTDLSIVAFGERQLVFIGKACDIEDIALSVNEIAVVLLACYSLSPDIKANQNFLNYMDGITGRYCFFIIDNGRLYAFNDLAGYKSVYYHTKFKILASHYNIIHSYTKDEPLDIDFFQLDPEYRSRNLTPPWVLPGDATPHKNINLLIPNHYYDSLNGWLTRYYPHKELKRTDVQAASAWLAEKLKGVFQHFATRYKLLHSLTFGFDSRLSLAVSREVKDRIKYFTFFSSSRDVTNPTWRDMENNYLFAKDLAADMKLDYMTFNLEDSRPLYTKGVREDFRQNHYLCSNPLFTISLDQHGLGDYVHLKSINEIIRESYFFINGTNEFEILRRFTHWAGYQDNTPSYEHARRIFHIWMNRIGFFKLMKEYPDYLYGDLYFLEYRMAQWMAAVNIENDSAIDTIMPVNCRKFLDMALAIPKELKDRNVLARNIIEYCWPELLEKYMYPNKFRPLNKSLDFYIHRQPGKVQVYDSLFNHNNFKIISGNQSRPNQIAVQPYYEVLNEGVLLSFNSANIEMGDFCKLIFNFPTIQGHYYYLSFILETNHYHFPENDGFMVQVFINSVLVYEISTIQFARPNMLTYSYKCGDESSCLLEIILISKRNTTGNAYNSLIKIEKIFFHEEYCYKHDTPKLTATEYIVSIPES